MTNYDEEMPAWMRAPTVPPSRGEKPNEQYAKGYADGARDSAKPRITPMVIYQAVAHIMSELKKGHYTFGAERRLWDRAYDLLFNAFHRIDPGFPREMFA